MNDKLESTYIPHLRSQFSRASPVLFTGAGFSVGARNKIGTSIPTTEQLCHELFQILFPGETNSGDDSLMDLFEAAKHQHRAQLIERMNELLTVDPTSLPQYYCDIWSMPWNCSYTLNLDDLALAASRVFTLPREICSRSGTNLKVDFNPVVANGSLELTHLNGCLSDVPDHVTFATTQYAERLAAVDPTYLKFVADYLSRPVVFIGSTLDEAPLWKHIQMRHHRGGREQSELRPRSYLVTPSLSRSRETLLSTYNTVWLKMTAEEFSTQVLSKLRQAARSGLVLLEQQARKTATSRTKISTVESLMTDPLRQTDYLIGQEPDWSDIQSGRAIKRQVDEEIADKVDEILSSNEMRGILILSGTAGSGKSSSLMRIALRLTAKGLRVGWIDSSNSPSTRKILSEMQMESSPSVLVIDDSITYGNELSTMLNEVVLLDSRPLVMLEVRSGSKDRVINVAQLRDIPIAELSMPHLEDQDIERLIAVLDKENRLGILKGKSHNLRVNAFKEQANRQLLVAMYQATTGRKFREKITEELKELDTNSQFIYGLVALATVHRFDLSTDEIVIAVGDKTNNTLNIVEQLLKSHLLVRSKNRGYLRARHRVIAVVVADELQERGELYDILHGLISVGLSKIGVERRRNGRAYRLIKTFCNHDMLFRLLDAQQARALYGSFEIVLHWDYHYWLQRGSLEVKEGDLNLAENFLNQARSLAVDDPYVDNEWAYLLFRKAVTKSGALDAAELVDEATQILIGLISDGRGNSEYPYHVLGSQGLSWARRGISSDREKETYLRKLVSTVTKGTRRFPHSDELRQLQSDLQKELLSLAIPLGMRSESLDSG